MSRLEGKRVLLVDVEDYATITIPERLLRRLGATPLLAHTGTAAQELLKEDPDLVLLGLYIPAPTGFELLPFIAERHPHLLARTIIMTAETKHDRLYYDIPILRKPWSVDDFCVALIARLDSAMPTLPPIDQWRAELLAARPKTPYHEPARRAGHPRKS